MDEPTRPPLAVEPFEDRTAPARAGADLAPFGVFDSQSSPVATHPAVTRLVANASDQSGPFVGVPSSSTSGWTVPVVRAPVSGPSVRSESLAGTPASLYGRSDLVVGTPSTSLSNRSDLVAGTLVANLPGRSDLVARTPLPSQPGWSGSLTAVLVTNPSDRGNAFVGILDAHPHLESELRLAAERHELGTEGEYFTLSPRAAATALRVAAEDAAVGSVHDGVGAPVLAALLAAPFGPAVVLPLLPPSAHPPSAHPTTGPDALATPTGYVIAVADSGYAAGGSPAAALPAAGWGGGAIYGAGDESRYPADAAEPVAEGSPRARPVVEASPVMPGSGGDFTPIEVDLPAGVPLAGVLGIDVIAVGDGVHQALGRIAALGADPAAGWGADGWLAAAAVLAGGAAWTGARVRRARPGPPDGVFLGWGGEDDGRLG